MRGMVWIRDGMVMGRELGMLLVLVDLGIELGLVLKNLGMGMILVLMDLGVREMRLGMCKVI